MKLKKKEFYYFYLTKKKSSKSFVKKTKLKSLLKKNVSNKKLEFFNLLFTVSQKIIFFFKIPFFKFFQSPLLIPFISHFVNYFFFYFIFIFFFYEQTDMLRVWKNWEIYIACFNFFLQFIISIFS